MGAAADQKADQPAAKRGLATVWVKLDTQRRHSDVSVLHARLYGSLNPTAPDYAAAYDAFYGVVRPRLCTVGEATVHHVSSPEEGRWLTDKGRISCNTTQVLALVSDRPLYSLDAIAQILTSRRGCSA